jgi:DNA mismatch endonuclease (patch repair protein)
VSYWQQKLKRNVERDAHNLQQLRHLGWRCLVVWECETNNPSRLRKRLQTVMTRFGNSPPHTL